MVMPHVPTLEEAFLQALQDEEQYRKDRWLPEPHQIPPKGNWRGWAIMAGRGSGKTDACANYVVEHVKGPACLSGASPHWIGIVAPTIGDAVTACFSGPSGIRAHDPDARLVGGTGGASIHWPDGSEAKLFGADKPEQVERLRAGGNRCLVWMEELAAWRYLQDCWDHIKFGLRVGPHPRWIASTTPKPRPLIKKIVKGEIKRVVVTHATTYDNPHLNEDVREDFLDTYEGTDLGAQELRGLLIDQVTDAFWRRANLDRDRVDEAPHLKKISVGVDPSGGAGEQGIIAVGCEELWTPERKRQLHGYVLADYSANVEPAAWGRRAVECAVEYEADDILVEINFGGAMATATIQGAADAMGISIPVRTVTASRGKRVRAEPVAALSSRARWHHVGRHEELEDQLCTWTLESDYSPDRLDGMVWPAWHQKMVSTSLRAVGSYGGGAMNNRIIG